MRNQTGWQLHDWHVKADHGKGRSVYVRELIDIGSHEFSSSALSARERLDIILAVGEEHIHAAMVEIATEKQRRYAVSDWLSDLASLKRQAQREESKEK